MTDIATVDAGETPPVAAGHNFDGRGRRVLRVLSPKNVSALYILVLVMVVFGLWIPDTFLQSRTAAQVLNENAVAGIVAFAVLVPLVAGMFDLSTAYTVGVTNVFVAYLLERGGLPLPVIVALCLLLGIVIGAVNGFIIVVLRIDSFIATLATGSLLQALILLISGDRSLVKGITPGFLGIARHTVFQVALPAFYLVVLAVVLWYFLEHRAVGRELRAVGLSPEAARLMGVRVRALQFGSLVVGGFLASVAGVVVTATVGGGSPTVGPPYLIPSFTAVFLGATQLKSGLFNIWGTVLSIILLGAVYTGLSLAGVPIWVPNVVTGVVLVAALGLTVYERKKA
jgi:ribose transport system permease protein